MNKVALMDLAMEKIKLADALFASGEYTSPFQGIPFAIKIIIDMMCLLPVLVQVSLLTPLFFFLCQDTYNVARYSTV